MYQAQVTVRGIRPILQNKFTIETLQDLGVSARKSVSKEDAALQWIKGMYVTSDGFLYQPANHFEASMVKAAVEFKFQGKKTYKDHFRSWVYVQPEEIQIYRDGLPLEAPDEGLMQNPTPYLSVSIMRVVNPSSRGAVARSRLQIEPGWEAHFCIEIHDPIIHPDTVRKVLEEAGRSKGVGDFRPRYGKFEVVSFEAA